MKKRWISLALCLALLLSLAPGALAADIGADTVTGTFTYCPALGMVGVCFMACLTAANRSEGRITVLRQIRNLGLASIGLGAVLIFFMAGATIRTLPEEDVAFFIVPLLCMTVTMLCALCLHAVGRARVAAVLAAAQLIIAAPGIFGVSVGYIAGFSIEFAMLVVPSVVSMALLYGTPRKLTDMTK